MTVASRDDPEDATHCPSTAKAQCCAHDHPHDESVPGEAESQCGGGCCGDDEDSDCESNADPCEDSCCGHHEDHSVHEQPAHEEDQQGAEHIGSCIRRWLTRLTPHQISVAQPQSNLSQTIQVAVTHRRMRMKIRKRPASVFPMELMGVSERLCSGRLVADRMKIPPQVPFSKVFYLWYHSIRTAIGTPSEGHDPGFFTDTSDTILLKELKSIIQEHSTHRLFFVLRVVDGVKSLKTILRRSPP